MPAALGIFVLCELGGEAGRAIRAVQERYDRKLARLTPPHVTIAGSSGVGPIPIDTPVSALRDALAPIAADTPPLALPFDRPVRFMQTEIVALPLDPHGPLRRLHERIATSGLRFKPARFLFTPHATLSYYPTLTPRTERELLAVRVTAPALIDRLQVFLTRDPQPATLLLDLPLTGAETPPPPAGAPPVRLR